MERLLGRLRRLDPNKIDAEIERIQGTVEKLAARARASEQRASAERSAAGRHALEVKRARARGDRAVEKRARARGTLALRRAKTHDAAADRLDGYIQRLEGVVLVANDLRDNRDAYEGMRSGAALMNTARRILDPDAVANTMDELTGYMDDAAEVNETLAQPLGGPLDDDAFDDEFAALLELDDEDELPAAAAAAPSASASASRTGSGTGERARETPPAPETEILVGALAAPPATVPTRDGAASPLLNGALEL